MLFYTLDVEDEQSNFILKWVKYMRKKNLFRLLQLFCLLH